MVQFATLQFYDPDRFAITICFYFVLKAINPYPLPMVGLLA